MGELETFAKKAGTVKIAGAEYALREMTLAEKIRVFAPIADQLKAMIKSNAEDINLERLLLGSASVIESILRLSIPGFKDWDKLPESETRKPLNAALEVNDFGGFYVNFLTLAGKITPSQKPLSTAAE